MKSPAQHPSLFSFNLDPNNTMNPGLWGRSLRAACGEETRALLPESPRSCRTVDTVNSRTIFCFNPRSPWTRVWATLGTQTHTHTQIHTPLAKILGLLAGLKHMLWKMRRGRSGLLLCWNLLSSVRTSRQPSSLSSICCPSSASEMLSSSLSQSTVSSLRGRVPPRGKVSDRKFCKKLLCRERKGREGKQGGKEGESDHSLESFLMTGYMEPASSIMED